MQISKVWAEEIPEPSEANLRRVGCANFSSFVNGGTLIAQGLAPAVLEHLHPAAETPRVLDFGCGIGRVALPLRHFLKVPTDCSDIDESAIAYLADVLPDANCVVNNFDPPLPFEDSCHIPEGSMAVS